MLRPREVNWLMWGHSAVLCRSRGQSPVSWDFWTKCFLSHREFASVLSHVWLFATLWSIAHQDPLSMEFFRLEYWNRLPFPPPGDLSNPGIEPGCPALAGRFFTTESLGLPLMGDCISVYSKRKVMGFKIALCLSRDFLVTGTLSSQYMGPGFHPCSGN